MDGDRAVRPVAERGGVVARATHRDVLRHVERGRARGEATGHGDVGATRDARGAGQRQHARAVPRVRPRRTHGDRREATGGGHQIGQGGHRPGPADAVHRPDVRGSEEVELLLLVRLSRAQARYSRQGSIATSARGSRVRCRSRGDDRGKLRPAPSRRRRRGVVHRRCERRMPENH